MRQSEPICMAAVPARHISRSKKQVQRLSAKWTFNAPANYDAELIRTLVREVHAAGARVMAHTTGPIANELVRLGVDSIEHGPRLDAETVRLMADCGASWTPTVWTMMKNVGPALTLPEPVGSYLRGIIEGMQETLALAADLGVSLMAGSDEAPHGSLHRELQALHDFGLSPQQTLATATSTARRYLHLPPAEVTADFVTFWDDPRCNLATLAEPAAIVMDGVLGMAIQ
jgi:imidazolonepropionase-like amidohydrolase